MTPESLVSQNSSKSVNKPSNHAGRLAIILLIIVIIVVAGGLAVWWLTKKPASTPPSTSTPTTTNEFKLPPLPAAFYDISGTVKEVAASSFTLATRLRTDKDTISEGYKDVVLTVKYDPDTRWLKRGPYLGNGQVPTLTPATAKDLAPGLAVDVRSRENLRGLESFMAAEVIIKNSSTAKK